jgi:hypothetical protein
MTTRKLRDLRFRVQTETWNIPVAQVPPDIGDECRPVEFFAASNLSRVTVHAARLSCA